MSARYLVSLGFLISGAALLHMSRFTLDITFSDAMWARVWQASGLAFLFVPLNTAIYATVPREKNNNISGMTNLARNLGGSIGISRCRASSISSHQLKVLARPPPCTLRRTCTT